MKTYVITYSIGDKRETLWFKHFKSSEAVLSNMHERYQDCIIEYVYCEESKGWDDKAVEYATAFVVFAIAGSIVFSAIQGLIN